MTASRFPLLGLTFGAVASFTFGGFPAFDAIAIGDAETQARWDTFEDENLKGMRRLSDNPDAVVGLIRKVATEDYPQAAEFLIDFLDDRNAPHLGKMAAAEVLGGFEDPEARELLKETATRNEGKNLYLLRAYFHQGDPESRLYLLNLAAKAPTPRIQGMAIEAIRELGDLDSLSEGYLKALKTWIEDEETFHGIRVSAARTLGQIPSQDSAAILVAQLRDPLLREVARDGLTRMTGLNHWNDEAGWQIWWKENQASFRPTPLSEADFVQKKAELEAASADATMEFYGIRLMGKNILFVLDASGSMVTDDRMERLKDELAAMIDQLHEKYRFGLLLFPRSAVPGRDVEQANADYRERVQKFVQRMEPGGGTPMWDALDYAFRRVVPKENIDTVYLLSDGIPSDLPPDELKDELMGYCDRYGTTIHTIFIGDSLTGQDLMEDVAEMAGGRFVHIP